MKEFINDLKQVTMEDILGGCVVIGYAAFAYIMCWAFTL